jgi:hypothetical protein
VFGTAETCDIVLPKVNGISRKHCALTFEELSLGSGEYQFVFRDLSRNKTTRMTYDSVEKGIEKSNGAGWIVYSQGSPNPAVRMELVILDDLRFRIAVEVRDMGRCSYRARIERFLEAA